MLSRLAVQRGLGAIASNARSLSSATVAVDNPYTGEIHCEIPQSNIIDAKALLRMSSNAQQEFYWETDLSQRIELCANFVKEFEKRTDVIAHDISCSMGRPVKQARGEVKGSFERVFGMMDLAPKALSPVELGENNAIYHRSIHHEPVGVVLAIAPWNYPILTTVNSVIPALLAGNSVVIRHSERTPQIAEHFVDAFTAAGAPEGLVTALHCSHATVAETIADERVGFVSFTGSVGGGRAVYSAVAQSRFIDATLELGGKDPAYVANDADLQAAIDTLVDGAFFNAGQSCCGIERVYVHRSLYDDFIAGAKAQVESYVQGDPMSDSTNMGPMAQPNAPGFLKSQVKDAASKGAKVITGGSPTTDENGKGRFFQPTLVGNCNHDMRIMKEESFGPVLAVQAVDSDDEAIRLMNDSDYGLTACIFTQDNDKAAYFAPRVATGTFFQNRADYLDPYLAWGGVKNTGKGSSLSEFGFRGVTKLKNYHFKKL